METCSPAKPPADGSYASKACFRVQPSGSAAQKGGASDDAEPSGSRQMTLFIIPLILSLLTPAPTLLPTGWREWDHRQ